MSIYNLVQNSEDFATISTSGYFQFHNEVSFYGSSMLEGGGRGESGMGGRRRRQGESRGERRRRGREREARII